MKKFFLLMALVLTAGVVHAQNTPNFGNRANLKQAKRANCNVGSPTGYTWSQNNELLRQIFNEVQNADNIPSGQTMASTYENFVIRVSGLSGSFSVQFLDNYDNVLHTFNYFKDDVHISPLRSLFSDDEINRIHKVKLIGRGNSGSLTLEEAYFISALKELDFKDKDGVDIGNAYIDPSYLIRSNRIWVDINSDRSFYINIAAGNQLGTLSFSLPYKTGIDVSNVSFTATDFDRTADVFNRYIVNNWSIDLNTGNEQYRTIRNLYNSRYSGAFYDQEDNDAISGVNYFADGSQGGKARQHANQIYWQAFGFTTTSDRRVWVQDLCLTKNKIQARLTRKPLELTDWTQSEDDTENGGAVWGFRNREYPVQPYYVDDFNWSDVVRGDWNSSNTFNYTDLSRYNKMRIIGSPNTKFDIRYATALSNEVNSHYNVPVVSEWKTFTVKTDARGAINDSLYASGEVNIDLDFLKAKDNSANLYLGAILFNGLDPIKTTLGTADNPGARKNYWCNDVELYEGEGRLVDLVGSTNPNDKSNMYHVWNNDNNYQWQYATVVRWACPSFENNIGNKSNLIWGTDGVYAENYADLTGYNAIRVYGTNGQAVRFVYNTRRNGYAPYLNNNSAYLDEEGKGDGNVIFRKDRTITITDHGEKGSYAELDISNFEYFHLNGIKAPYGQDATITAIKLVEDEEADYIFYGNGSYGEQGRAPIDHSVNMASNDLTAKVIDARARCNNMQVEYDESLFGSGPSAIEHITLPKTGSQNVLFISRNGQFNRRKIGDHIEKQWTGVDANGDTIFVWNHDHTEILTKIVDDVEDFNLLEVSGDENVNEYTCTNLKLVDGLSFYAPKKIKAGTATYTRTFNNPNVVNTIILPFAVNAGSATEKKSAGFYVATQTLQSTANEGKVGILEEQDVKKGDWLLQFRKYTGNTDPNTPYLYAVTNGTGKNVFEGVATEDSKVIIPETPDVLVEGKLRMSNYEDSFTDVNGEMKEGYYLRGVYEGTCLEDILFYSADGKLYRTPRMTVTPFRTIIHSPIPVTSTSYEADQDAYFGIETANDVKVVLAFDPDDDQAVAIENVEVDGLFAEDAPIYNVAGQRVNTLEKGIYIVAGKKILVK